MSHLVHVNVPLEGPCSELARTLFPPGVVVCRKPADQRLVAELDEEELQLILRAVDKRRWEFAAGRSAAKCGLEELGRAPTALLASAERDPRWPPGVVGSITHTEGFCGAAVGDDRSGLTAIGFDAERMRSLAPDVAKMVLSAREEASWPSGVDRGIWAMLTFSAKESVYKCLFPLLRIQIGFEDVSLEFGGPSEGFSARVQPTGHQAMVVFGRCATSNDHLFTSCFLQTSRGGLHAPDSVALGG